MSIYFAVLTCDTDTRLFVKLNVTRNVRPRDALHDETPMCVSFQDDQSNCGTFIELRIADDTSAICLSGENWSIRKPSLTTSRSPRNAE